MIAVDTNVIAYLLIDSEHTDAAEALFQKDREWIAPILWRSEFRNILAGHMRVRKMTLEAARRIQARAEDLMAGNEHDVDSAGVLELIHGSSSSAYDCEFVALAHRQGVKLVTADARLRKAFPKHTMSLST